MRPVACSVARRVTWCRTAASRAANTASRATSDLVGHVLDLAQEVAEVDDAEAGALLLAEQAGDELQRAAAGAGDLGRDLGHVGDRDVGERLDRPSSRRCHRVAVDDRQRGEVADAVVLVGRRGVALDVAQAPLLAGDVLAEAGERAEVEGAVAEGDLLRADDDVGQRAERGRGLVGRTSGTSRGR